MGNFLISNNTHHLGTLKAEADIQNSLGLFNNFMNKNFIVSGLVYICQHVQLASRDYQETSH
jgi:hypothetical protein